MGQCSLSAEEEEKTNRTSRSFINRNIKISHQKNINITKIFLQVQIPPLFCLALAGLMTEPWEAEDVIRV